MDAPYGLAIASNISSFCQCVSSRFRPHTYVNEGRRPTGTSMSGCSAISIHTCRWIKCDPCEARHRTLARSKTCAVQHGPPTPRVGLQNDTGRAIHHNTQRPQLRVTHRRRRHLAARMAVAWRCAAGSLKPANTAEYLLTPATRTSDVRGAYINRSATRRAPAPPALPGLVTSSAELPSSSSSASSLSRSGSGTRSISSDGRGWRSAAFGPRWCELPEPCKRPPGRLCRPDLATFYAGRGSPRRPAPFPRRLCAATGLRPGQVASVGSVAPRRARPRLSVRTPRGRPIAGGRRQRTRFNSSRAASTCS